MNEDTKQWAEQAAAATLVEALDQAFGMDNQPKPNTPKVMELSRFIAALPEDGTIQPEQLPELQELSRAAFLERPGMALFHQRRVLMETSQADGEAAAAPFYHVWNVYQDGVNNHGKDIVRISIPSTTVKHAQRFIAEWDIQPVGEA